MGGYVGIDESNHGNLPEYYVATYSPIRGAPHQHHGLHKIRQIHFSMPDGYDWRYLLFDAFDKELLGDTGIKVVAATEFIRFYSEIYGTLNKVSFDGETKSDQVLEDIARELYPLKMPPVHFEKQADKKYPLVNAADAMAYSLYKRGAQCEHNYLHDTDHFRTFEQESYPGLIDRYQRHQAFKKQFQFR